ncbi:MAG TPA: 4-coumarate--CoA ligase family protein [Actinomycetes bacterium]|nr:4-coumarate--CoA ligase family protein [Actinomycetes bacterium]
MTRTDATVFSSPWPDVDVPDVDLATHVLATAERLGDKPALVDGPSGRTVTYRRLADGAGRVAAGLAAKGLRKGDVFAMLCPNLPEYALAFYGVAAAGGVSTTVNPLFTADELARQLADSRARWILTVPPLAPKAVEAAGRTGIEEVFVLGEAEGLTPFAALAAAGGDPPRVRVDPAEDLVALPYSSGTTGLPKGVLLSHRNVVANLCQCRPVLSTDEHDVVLAVLPFFHIYGLTVVMGSALSAGATLVTMPRFDLEEFLRLHAEHRVTRGFLVPPIMLALARHPLVDAYDLSALEFVTSGAAPLSAELEAAVEQRLGCVVTQGYGLTETSPVVTTSPGDPARIRHGSVGQLLPNTQLMVVEPQTGEPLPQGETGELCFRGPQIMQGYLRDPDATAAMLRGDGWLATGDLGHVDPDGFVFVVDRVKELIKYKGLQIAPAELEAVLLEHPEVADAAVIRVPDEEAGEVPKAYVVAAGEVDAQDVLRFVAERVAPYKQVRQLEFIDRIPRAPSGKILRRVLMARAAEGA